MVEWLPPTPLFLAFLVASFVLAATPGAGVLFIVSRSLLLGRRSALASVAGVAAGNLGNAIAASLGLAAVLALSELAFAIVKYAGAAYLIYLGVDALRRRGGDHERDTHAWAATSARIFLDGFIVALLNPKTALFFAAFLPHFLGQGSDSLVSILVLSVLFVGIAATTDTVYALVAASAAPGLARLRHAGYWVGGALVALGVMAILSGSRSAVRP